MYFKRFNYAIGIVITKIGENNMNVGSKRSCDVLIIGGGSAGLRASN